MRGKKARVAEALKKGVWFLSILHGSQRAFGIQNNTMLAWYGDESTRIPIRNLGGG